MAIDFGRAKRRGLLAHFHRHGRVEIQDIVALFVDAGLTPTRKGPLGMNRRAYSIVVATVTGVSRWF